jgi:pimeloyl-ACP methyl ester carboxylesterase
MPKFNDHAMNLFYEIAGDGLQTITFIHGLGSEGRTFSKVKEYSGFQDYRLLFIDLPGFGRSDKPEQFDYSMSSQAEVCCGLFDYLGIQQTVLIGHSMGGVIGQILAERFPVLGFINCEGNLILDDCKMSAEISAMGLSEFETGGFDELKQRAAGTSFYEGYCQTTAYAMYHSARQLVESCRNGNLLDRFIRLPLPKLYVYGERTRGKRKSEQSLIHYGLDLKYIPDSGHNMIIENPDAFYRVAADFLMKVRP